jgi:transcriptional regulator with XRE-family HTH domain
MIKAGLQGVDFWAMNTDAQVLEMSAAPNRVQLEPKLKSTGEIPTVKAIYGYLSGDIALKIELIPYIAEVLEIPEQFLFDDSSRARKIFLKHILKDISNEEKELLKSKICPEQNQKIDISKDRFHTINDLLVYAPEIFLENLENTLKNYKDLTLKFTK